MKKAVTIIITILLATLSNADESLKMIAPNPILNDYTQNITFYLSFNGDRTAPEVAMGNAEPIMKEKVITFSNGLFGKALEGGRIKFSGAGNTNLSQPGTIIMWVSPQNWKKSAKEPYIIPFVGHRDTGYNLQFGRQGGAWKKARIYAYAYFSGKKNYTYLPIYNHGGGHVWKNGEWHMLALSWNATTLNLSVDGGKTVSKMTTAPLGLTFKFFTIQVPSKNAPKLLVDEFVILDKQLSNDELIDIYRKTMKKVKK